MWTSIIVGLLPLVIKIILGILSKKEERRKAKEAFLNFVAEWESVQKTSVQLNESDREQMDDLKRQREEYLKNKENLQ